MRLTSNEALSKNSGIRVDFRINSEEDITAAVFL